MASTTGPEAETLPFQRIISTIISTKSSGDFHDKWSSLAMVLHTPSDRIKRIRDDRLVNKITLMDTLHEIIEEWHARCGSAATLDKLLMVFEDLDLNSLGEALRLEFNLPCKGFENPSLSWDMIGRKFQLKVESSLETFYPSITFDHESKSRLSRKSLIDLVTCQEPSPFNNTIPEALKYYVPRTIVTRDMLTGKLFEKSSSSDIFLFTGIERHSLSSKSRPQRTDTTTSQLDRRNKEVKHMILDLPSHFLKFSSLTGLGSPIHHIQFKENKFIWIQSVGSLHNLRRFIGKHQIHLSESEFLDRICSSNLPVCISDSPGMGKSEMLKQIARHTINMFPGRIIIFQEFPKFIDVVKRQSNVTKDLLLCIQTALEELICRDELGRRILKLKLESESKTIELLLDGYDELSALSMQTANEIITEIHVSLKSIRLWITARPHLLHNLENMFTVLGYTMQSFTPEDQINFLTSYWSREQDLPIARLKLYATNCLKQLKTTLSAREEDIAGVPLQCLMIGEVYEEEATDYSRGDDEFSGIKIRVTSITDLYKLTIERKLNKYQSTYGKQKPSNKELINMHIQLALKLILPRYFDKPTSQFINVQTEEVLNVGILESRGSARGLQFIHRTFAEYFVALFVVHVLSGEGAKIGLRNNDHCELNLKKLRFRELLSSRETPELNKKTNKSTETCEFIYPVICLFIDSFLSGSKVEENISKAFVEMFKDEGEIVQLAESCVNGDFINIFNLFDSYHAFDKYEKQLFDEDFVMNAIKKSGVGLIKTTMDKFERNNKFDINLQMEALRAAVKRGIFNPVEFLIIEKQLDVIIMENWKVQIVHCCVEYSVENSEEIIRQKMEVIQYLVQMNPLLLEEKDKDGNVPLVCKNVDVRLAINLIELGANVFAKNCYNETILHFTCYSPEEYHSLLINIKSENLAKLINIKAGQQQHTPLLRLIKHMDPEGHTVDIFRDAGADFNICEKYSIYPLLSLAIEEGRNATTLRKLIECGSDVNWKGQDGCNHVHLASKYYQLDAIYTISQFNVDMNAFNNNLETPLHIGAKHGEWADCLIIIKAIIECGGDPTLCNKVGNTFINELLYRHRDITAKNFNDVIELLVHFNCISISEIENQTGNSSLMVALETLEVETETLSLLLKHGVNLSKSTTGGRKPTDVFTLFCEGVDVSRFAIAGRNLIHAASLNLRYQVIPFLVKIGLNVNERDSASMTPLHYASRYRSRNEYGNVMKMIKALLENGADVYATIKGDTFLHTLLRRQEDMYDHQFLEIAKFLAELNYINLFNIRGNKGVTPLHLVAKLAHVKAETMSFLNMGGVKFGSEDDTGDSVLAYAVRAEKTQYYMEYLIRCGANEKIINHLGQNLLHIAADYLNADLIELFINAGIDVKGVDRNGDTPLHLCLKVNFARSTIAGSRRLQIARLLVGNGASVVILNKKGLSPLSIAMKRLADDEELLRLLSSGLADETSKHSKQVDNGNPELHTEEIL